MRITATAAVYNRLHNTSVGVVGGGSNSGTPGGVCSGGLGHHHQLARSLERILEEAHLSGELILTNRKLKDFPKTGTKYNLQDTVMADLSRNRFCELPEEITSFSFLETLLLYHNAIRSIPESVKHFTSLTYLDLRSNQLSSLPREFCFLPLEVLLVSNNRLTVLPDELGRMDRLTDLDASYNQLSTLPARIGELRSLRSFSLRSNQLMYLPRELSCLTLVLLDVSNNRISSLPLEIRQMSTLVELFLENNPMTSPPASLCTRGLVHVFKYLETQAAKEEKGSRAGNYDGYTTLRRVPRNNYNGDVLQIRRSARHLVDPGYSTCDGNDKRWSHDVSLKSKRDSPKSITSTIHPSARVSILNTGLMDVSSTIIIVDGSVSLVDAVIKPLNNESQSTSEVNCSQIKGREEDNLIQLELQRDTHNHSSSSSGSTSDLHDDLIDYNQQQQQNEKIDDKVNESFANIQTYREYKEALKQQRSQDVYKVKAQKQIYECRESKSSQPNEETKMRLSGNTQSSPVPKSIMTNGSTNSNTELNDGSIVGTGCDMVNDIEENVVLPKKPVQKVITSRNDELMYATKHDVFSTVTENRDCIGYVKPSSPIKTLNCSSVNGGNCLTGIGVGILTTNNKFTTVTTTSVGIKSPVGSNSNKIILGKGHRNVTWNHDIVSDKLSFTMRREFDRQREEIELMTQLRIIIESRLKMTLPDDIASALTDGVILCHLANYVRPRSVVSIHVPSPGVSKLTMARCRRNVDNFLEACRKIGVDEELICSCADVTPLSATDIKHDDFNDNNDRNINNTRLYRNNNNFYYVETDTKNKTQNHQFQLKLLPNPSAVFRTVAALIAMDCNPQHQNIKNLEHEYEFQMRLQEYQNHLHIPQRFLEDNEKFAITKKFDLSKERACMLLADNDSLHEKGNESKDHDENSDAQNNLTATYTKNQMIEFGTSNYDKFIRCDNNFNSAGSGSDFYYDSGQSNYCYNRYGYDITSRCNNEKQLEHKYFKSFTTTSGARNLYNHCKLKTFEKIKLNLITHHGNAADGASNHFSSSSSSSLLSSSMQAKTLQTIIETDDVITDGTSSSGLCQIIDEKYKIELTAELTLKKVNSKSWNNFSATSAANIAHMKYKLFDLSSSIEKPFEKYQSNLSSTAAEKTTLDETATATSTEISNTVSKRIEFFEHANLPNGGIIKPKSNIYSIYRVNDKMLVENEKLVKNVVTINESGSPKSATFQLRHDTYTLTIILSIVFIATFLLLVFFPLPG